MRPTRVVSIHYPCLALKAGVQGKVRLRCAVANNGRCGDPKIVYGHPLFYRDAIQNARKWMFPQIAGGSRSRVVDIDYTFEIRGVRTPKDNDDVDVTIELPNTVIVTAPFDANIPCGIPPIE